MRTRKFGSAKIKISEVGLGTWQIGGSWGDISQSEGRNILNSAYASGVTFFDTADVYGDGKSEKLIGHFLKTTKPGSVFVATKLGRWSQPGWPANFTQKTMRQHTQASLERLGVDALDLTQLHCVPTEVLRKGDIFDNLRILKREGLIRQFGASVESMEEALICLEQEGLASLQIIFNVFRQKPIKALFEFAQAKDVAIIVRLPLASGLLTGKINLATKFPKTDHRNFNRDGQSFNVGETFAGLKFEDGVRLAGELKSFVPEGMTMAQMALRWILDFEAVTTIIPGASRPEQIASNVSASDLPKLTPQLHDQLTKWYETNVADKIRGKY
jgi:aryl-alcohol dehydrogenase-like predicted oxidoreductase